MFSIITILIEELLGRNVLNIIYFTRYISFLIILLLKIKTAGATRSQSYTSDAA